MTPLHLEPLVAPWALLLAAGALGAAAYLYYLRWDEGLDVRRRRMLFALRLAGFAVALLVLCGPTLRTERVVVHRRELAVLFDTSASMGERDGAREGGVTRLEAARAAFVSAAGRLARGFDLKVYSFDRAAEFLGEGGSRREQAARLVADLAPSGEATALGDALCQAAPRGAGGGVLVLSDGASNAGRAPGAAARELSARGCKVFAAAFGGTGRPNVTVERVLGPRLLLRAEPSALFAQVRFSGPVTGPARVVLKRDGRVVAAAEADPSRRTSLVRLNFTPDADGELTYEIEAEPLPPEENTADNRLEYTVRVAKEKLKVLYVEENPRWEYRFLKNAILRDERIAPKLLLRFADSELAGPEYNVTDFPKTRPELFALDVVVIGDVNPRFFLPRDLENLRAFVSEGGGGLLFVAGAQWNPARYGGTILGELVPADAEAPPASTKDGVRITLTDAGAANPALSLSADEQKEFWLSLPKIFRLLEVKPRAGATVLAKSVPGGLPVIVEQRFGRGRTMLIATDELWRWRRYVGDRYLYRLWAQLVRFLGARRLTAGEAAGELTLSADTYARSQRVRATAYLEDGLGMPFDEQAAEGFLEDGEGRRVAVSFSRAPEGRGLYRGEFPAGDPGRYTLYARGPAGFLSAGLTVSGEPLEALSREADAAALAAVASATGGRLLAPDEIGRIGEFLPPSERSSRRMETAVLWASWWFLLPLAACFCLEWFLRKRWDLL